MPKFDFNKAASQLYLNHTLAWLFSCKLTAYFQNTESWEQLWRAASENLGMVAETLCSVLEQLINPQRKFGIRTNSTNSDEHLPNNLNRPNVYTSAKYSHCQSLLEVFEKRLTLDIFRRCTNGFREAASIEPTVLNTCFCLSNYPSSN